MRELILLLSLFSPRLRGQVSAPRFMYIYRDSLKRGVDSAYRVVENDGAQICADLRCPNPYIGIESLSGPHELYVLRPVRTRRQADSLARQPDARVFAVRPNWSMPAPQWVAADPEFWRSAPPPRARP